MLGVWRGGQLRVERRAEPPLAQLSDRSTPAERLALGVPHRRHLARSLGIRASHGEYSHSSYSRHLPRLVIDTRRLEPEAAARVAAAPDEHSLVLNLVRLTLLDLPTIVQLKDQCLVKAWIEDDLLDTITLRDLIHTFFDINKRLSKMQWFNFILAHALILKSHSQ